ncbi:MAG: B12-binding domain-containing radical SAM protein, partial [Clostridiales bacterium]|nr:B12-binding domain-containing radical SAM protein [Clostridiales bacterium]
AYFAVPKEQRSPGLRITVSASVFVPKPDTPFQWSPQLARAEVVRRQKLLLGALARLKGVEFKYHAPDLSFLEACFALGDRRMADVLERAYQLGCRFDGWSDQFKMDLWMRAFADAGIDPEFYATRGRGPDEVLPWDHLDAGVTKAFLLREWDRAQRAEITPDCRLGCIGCGLTRYEGACV